MKYDVILNFPESLSPLVSTTLDSNRVLPRGDIILRALWVPMTTERSLPVACRLGHLLPEELLAKCQAEIVVQHALPHLFNLDEAVAAVR